MTEKLFNLDLLRQELPVYSINEEVTRAPEEPPEIGERMCDRNSILLNA